MALTTTHNPPYISPTGEELSSLYWRLDFLATSIREYKARAVLLAWRSEASYMAGHQPIQGTETEVKPNTPEGFAFLAGAMDTPGGPGLSSVVYSWAKKFIPKFADAESDVDLIEIPDIEGEGDTNGPAQAGRVGTETQLNSPRPGEYPDHDREQGEELHASRSEAPAAAKSRRRTGG